jgi:acyl carrier protein
MDIQDRLNQVFQEVLQDDSIQIKSEMTANEIEGWDSFSHVTLIVAIETRFEVKFSVKEVMGFKNVGDLIKGLERKLGS